MNPIKLKHSSHLLTYAINAIGELIHVDDVPTGNKCDCFCPACKEPLIAKNQGTKRMHHFSHQSGTECDHAIESMLHILAKEKIREAFLSKSEFWIKFKHKSYCSHFEDCKFIRYSECCKSEERPINIKEYYYDSCEQEMPYNNINRRSDLKIYSSIKPNRPPIYLEFFVTHASELQKLHSGNKIIEISIASEEDILQLIENGIIESDNNYDNKNKNSGNNSPKISFYGFKKEDFKNNNISNMIVFNRYILYESGKIYFKEEKCNCKKLAKSKPSSLLEICVHTFDSFDLYEKIKYIFFQKFQIPNCSLCQNYVDSYNGIEKICCLYKRLQIPRHVTFDTSRAKSCHSFSINHEEMQYVLKNGLNEEKFFYNIFDR